MKYEFLLVGLGGFLGATTRYATYLWFASRNLTQFPWATLAVNVLGCLLIGAATVFFERSIPYNKQLLLLGTVGFLGAFTTFSAFGFESFALLKSHQTGLALLNILANVCLGLGAVFLGRYLSSLFVS